MRKLLFPIILALVLAPAGLAATFSFSVTSSSPITAPTVTLSGDDQTNTFSVGTRVNYSGTPFSGWKVQASSTAPTAGTKTLPALTVTGGSYSCFAACIVNPTPTGVVYPITLSTTAQTIYNANTNTGVGTFNVSNTFQLSYPASALPGAYSATITLVGSTGP
jgi:hypothetical protein